MLLFTIALHEDPPLVLLRDQSRLGGKTITNEPEAVIEKVGRFVPDLSKRRVLYADSDGVWDELLLDGRGRFRDYGLIRARTVDGAIEHVRAEQRDTSQPGQGGAL